MRIVMPLYEFKCCAIQSFSFSDCDIAIKPFTPDEEIDFSELSKLDTSHIKSASWAFIYEGDGPACKPLVNLLLMSFRIFLDHRPPFIKYQLCKADNQISKLTQPMTYNYSAETNRIAYENENLLQIDTGFQHLQKMHTTSTRTKNALYFLYRAFHADKWIDSFVLMMCSLESLFSKDTNDRNSTKAITNRVSSLLSSQTRCTKLDIEKLYEIRSKMVHGRLEASDDPGENLKYLEHLEYVTVRCFRELVNNKAYAHYASKAARDRFMGTLNTSP